MRATDKTVLITGATGKTGSRIIDRLTAKGVSFRAASRNGAEPFDWDAPATWPANLSGAAAAYICYHPDLAFPGASAIIQEFTTAAVAAGVQRLVLLSGRGEPEAEVCERIVMASGVEWTVVRCDWFSQNFSESFLLDPVLSGEIMLPAGDAVEPFIDLEDVADVAAAALTEDGHAGQVYTLSGPRLLSFADVAAEIAEATGREVRYRSVSLEEFREILAEADLPADFADMFEMILDGRNASLTDGVRRAVGREPRDFRDFVRAAAAAGAWDAMVSAGLT